MKCWESSHCWACHIAAGKGSIGVKWPTRLWYCESQKTQISTVSTWDDLGLAHLPWHRHQWIPAESLSKLIFHDCIAAKKCTVLCWGRKVFNSPYMPFKIFFIIQFQDLMSLSLKEKIIFSLFLKDISIDFKTLFFALRPFFSHCKQKQLWEMTTL